jgi:uncharacterized protein (DUF1697 family)
VAIYVSLLRGINVGGNKRIKMDALRQSFEGLGFEQVKTFIQSGNVVYKSGKASTTALSNNIEKRLLDDFGFVVPVITRTAEELAGTIRNNSFVAAKGIDQEKLHVMFLSAAATPDAVGKLDALIAGLEKCRCLGREVYLYLPKGVAESKLMKAPLDRILSVVPTTRNWRTVNSLHQMCQDCR